MTAFYHFQTHLFKIAIDPVLHCYFYIHLLRGTQRQFLENIGSEDDLRSRIFRNICRKISYLPPSPRIFEHPKNGIIAGFLP